MAAHTWYKPMIAADYGETRGSESGLYFNSISQMLPVVSVYS